MKKLLTIAVLFSVMGLSSSAYEDEANSYYRGVGPYSAKQISNALHQISDSSKTWYELSPRVKRLKPGIQEILDLVAQAKVEADNGKIEKAQEIIDEALKHKDSNYEGSSPFVGAHFKLRDMLQRAREGYKPLLKGLSAV
jgi:soluble cytochrome b562